MSFLTKIFSRVKGKKDWDEHEIECKPLTLMCHKGDIDIRPQDNFLPLNPETTKYHGYRVDRIDPDAIPWIEHILGYPLVDKEDRTDSDAHIIGLVDLTVKLMKKGVTQFFVKEPETHLHPSQQSRIACFFSMITSLNSEGGRPFYIVPPNDPSGAVEYWNAR